MALPLRLQVEGITKEFPVVYFLMQQVLPGVVDRALPRMIGSMNSSLPTQKKSMLLLLSMLEEKGLQNLIVCSRPSCRTGTRRSNSRNGSHMIQRLKQLQTLHACT